MPEDQARGPTLETVLVRENLRRAWLAVKANSGAGGVDGMTIEQTRQHLKEHKETILKKLREGTYRPGALRAKEIPKPNGKKRVLGIPNVLDRVIQQAIQQDLSPEWEPDFSDHSYGYRPNRSAHDAVRCAQSYVKAGKTWVVDIDLKSFFDQVNHDKLMHLLREHVTDKGLRKLIGAYLRAPWKRSGGKLEKRTRGIPQGMPLSPLLANINLDPLDKELEK